MVCRSQVDERECSVRSKQLWSAPCYPTSAVPIAGGRGSTEVRGLWKAGRKSDKQQEPVLQLLSCLHVILHLNFLWETVPKPQ